VFIFFQVPKQLVDYLRRPGLALRGPDGSMHTAVDGMQVYVRNAEGSDVGLGLDLACGMDLNLELDLDFNMDLM
jgi:hypothetical protein